MKNSVKRKGIGVISLILTLIMGLTPMTAFAKVEPEYSCICEEKCDKEHVNPDCKVCQIDVTLCEGKEAELEESFGPLTPDGNLTLVDDYGSMEAGGKQFITVVTKKGNYFYIIIDRDDEGDETVHFLNMVDEADLFSLMDDEEAQNYIKSITGEDEESSPTPPPTVAPVEEPEKEERSSSPLGVLLLLLLIGGGTAGYFYYAGKKKQDVLPTYEDPDADYNEEEDYLVNLLDDDMDIEEEDEDITEDLLEEVE